MSGFDGFEEVKRDLQKAWSQSLVNLAVSPDAAERIGDHFYVTGRDLVSQRKVRVTLSDRRNFANRISLENALEQVGVHGVLVLLDCHQNRLGTFEARNVIAFSNPSLVLLDGMARVSAPSRRGDGSWGQSIQHIRTGQAALCGSYADVVESLLNALEQPGPGRSGAIIRAWHTEKGGVLGFEVPSVFDPTAKDYLGSEQSFDSFLASPDVYVGGIGATVSGEKCMDMVLRLLADSHKEVLWEVLPKRTYSLGSLAAEAAAAGGRDFSKPYRMSPGDIWSRSTGCLPTLIGFTDRGGVLWPRIAAPLRAKLPALPIPELRIASGMVKPDAVPTPNAARENVRAKAKRFMSSYQPPAEAAANPAVSDLLPLLAAAGPGSPDIGGLDGSRTEDLLSLAKVETNPAQAGLRR
jgi:hypothetical protein